MSRIIIKNLPSKVTESGIREQFSNCGTVTDVKLMKTQCGVFRRFAFVGYSTDTQALKAVEHFNKTFIKASKIEVEVAQPYGGSNLDRPWSKYSKGSSAFGRREKTEEKEEKNIEKEKRNIEKKPQITEKLDGLDKDSNFLEFLDAHKHSGKVWADGDNKAGVKGQQTEESNEETEVSDEAAPLKQEAVTDMDYLRSKMTNTQSDNSQSDSGDEATPPQLNTTPFTVKMLGLPFAVKEKGIREFFHPLQVAAIRFTTDSEGRPSGRAYADFQTESDLKKALKHHNDCIGHRYIELFRDMGPQAAIKEASAQPHKVWADVSGVEDVGETGRLFVRNLSYSTTEEDLRTLFERFGPLTEVTVPLDKTTSKSTGLAFITYMLPEHAVKALSALDAQIFQGRLLHILPAKPREGREGQQEKFGSSYKKSKQNKAKSEAGKGHNWNALFLGANTVVDAIADKYSISKSEVFDGPGGAVRLALGETQLVAETKAFMEAKGVQLDMFANQKAKRSKTIILVKNLPYGCTEKELDSLFEPFGHVSQVVLPPSGVSALVEFTEAIHARAAFTRLAYTSFKHQPLYLEWAPEEVIKTEKKAAATPPPQETESTSEQATVFVKNLNFDTTEKDFEQLMCGAGKVASISIARKRNIKDPSAPLSMGYGFVQYTSHKAALKAIRTLQHSELDEHQLELKLSTRQQKPHQDNGRKASETTKQMSAKILVRNIPFEASKNEVKDLFQTFGMLKTVRLPKKFGASQSEHRGFGFVEYSTSEEAKRAFDSLCQSTHLYGRRLVLEWAESEESVDAIRKRTAEHFVQQLPIEKRSKELLDKLEGSMKN